MGEIKKDTPFLYFCTISAGLLVFSGCSVIVWSSSVIPKLKSNNTEENPLGEPVTPFDIALITGLPSFAAILGNLLYAEIPNAIGRKKTLLFLSSGMLLSLLTVAFGHHVYIYSAALCFLFTCVAGVYVALPLYLSEISEDHNRGRILSLMGVLMPLGNLYGYLLGPLFTVRTFTLLLALPLILQLTIVTIFLPESPVFLLTKKEVTAAILALIKLRNNKNSTEIQEDYIKIEQTLTDQQNSNSNGSGLSALIKTPTIRKAFLISVGINLTQQLSGVISILKFLGPVFNDVTHTLSGNNIAILVGIVKFLSFLICSCFVENLGRRPLLLASSLGNGISLFFIGLFFFIKHNTSLETENLAWLPIISVLVFNFTYALGVGTLSITVMNELFPTNVKPLGSAVVFTVCYLLGSTQVFLFPIVSETFGVHICVWSFSLCSFFGFIFIFFLLPETKGKSFLEIQTILS